MTPEPGHPHADRLKELVWKAAEVESTGVLHER